MLACSLLAVFGISHCGEIHFAFMLFQFNIMGIFIFQHVHVFLELNCSSKGSKVLGLTISYTSFFICEPEGQLDEWACFNTQLLDFQKNKGL